MERRPLELLKVQTGRQPVPILIGTQPQGHPMSKPTSKKKKKILYEIKTERKLGSHLQKRGYPGGMYIHMTGPKWVMVLMAGTGHQVVAELL